VALEIGSQVGPYKITAEIGAGGMGVVYRAHDSRLGRDVAVKVSAERFSERFEREARAVAALNHPNICTLHDVGPDYLVMELVEGETLADVLAQRPRSSPGLPLDETLHIARQIASALDAAHDAGIVHRDLKPGNIKIKDDGTVKVLDFGLAKIHGSSEPASHDIEKLTHSPTLLVTQAGLILGTAAYMSPEQARGKTVDKRADIWAFGVVVYEMLTGRRPFDGEDVSTTVAAVIQSDPSWNGVPESMLRLLKRCLTKDSRRRLRDIGDVWELLDVASERAGHHSRFATTGWIAAAVLAIVAAAALWAPWRTDAPVAERPLVQLEIDLGADVSLPALVIPTPSSVAISPDGTRLAYLASIAGGTPRLFLRRLDQPRATELAGTEGVVDPFFSRDGQWLVFFDGSRLKKVSVSGGAAVPLMPAVIFAGATWIDDANLLVGSGVSQGLLRAPAEGGEPTQILAPSGNETFYAMPSMLPGGTDALIAVYSTPPNTDTAFIDVLSLKDRSRKTVARGGTAARYLPTGHLIYSNRNTMFAVPFDLATREARGAAVPVLTDMAYDPAAGIPQMDISRDGTLVYRRNVSREAGNSSLMWIDAAGKRQTLPARPARYASTPRLSPDGKKLATTVREGASQDVWIYDIERDSMTRLTFGTQTFVSAIWSPDGRYIVCGSIGNGLFWTRADGGGQPQQLTATKSISFPHSISADGKRLVYYEAAGSPQVWTVPIEQSGDGLKAGIPERYMETRSADAAAAISPDGRWLAYESNESGRVEIYVRPFPAPASGGGGKWQISNDGGTWPIWPKKGGEILYRSGDQVMAVTYTSTADSFSPEKPGVRATTTGSAPGFDLAPDGRLLLIMPAVAEGAKSEHTLMFVQNFYDELRRRVPVGK
jgi:Tol biopolymer transport system component/tRNA A-37 threonylcarbamoyl transferase component Bud32